MSVLRANQLNGLIRLMLDSPYTVNFVYVRSDRSNTVRSGKLGESGTWNERTRKWPVHFVRSSAYDFYYSVQQRASYDEICSPPFRVYDCGDIRPFNQYKRPL